MNPDKFPDMTLEEAVESDTDYSDFTEKDWEEIEDEIEERRNLMELAACSTMFTRMVRDNYITFREYIRLTEALDDYQDEWGVVL